MLTESDAHIFYELITIIHGKVLKEQGLVYFISSYVLMDINLDGPS